jgi:hypothetical protein
MKRKLLIAQQSATAKNKRLKRLWLKLNCKKQLAICFSKLTGTIYLCPASLTSSEIINQSEITPHLKHQS